jgi:DNA-binding NtrC family response regulator
MVKRSILYLDDEPVILDLFQEMFSDEYDIRIAHNVNEAKSALDERRADIIISDQRMPEILGTEFLRQIAETYPTSYRVMLTGNARVGDVIREISAGTINLFVAKPWTEDGMRQALERASTSFELRNKVHQNRNSAAVGVVR